MFWSLEKSCFSSFFFRPTSSCRHHVFSIYIRSVFCACQGGPKTRGLSIVLIHCHPLTSQLSFFFLCIKRRIVQKNAPVLVEGAGRWRNLAFSSFFFRPTSSCRHHVFFYFYSKCLLCLSGRSEDTWVINSSYPLSFLDLSTFFFLSF